MKIASCIGAVLVCCATAFAHIGEKEAQIERRYGQPTSGSRSTKGYSHKDFLIIVTFENGVSGIETYEKRNGSPMSAAEIRRLVRANGVGTKRHEPIQNGLHFQYQENNRLAEYNAATSTLTVADCGVLNRINARNQTLGAEKMHEF